MVVEYNITSNTSSKKVKLNHSYLYMFLLFLHAPILHYRYTNQQVQCNYLYNQRNRDKSMISALLEHSIPIPQSVRYIRPCKLNKKFKLHCYTRLYVACDTFIWKKKNIILFTWFSIGKPTIIRLYRRPICRFHAKLWSSSPLCVLTVMTAITWVDNH